MYTRISNPTVAAVEEKIASLEGGVGAMCTSSGQAANMLAILNIAASGDNFVSVSEYLRRYGEPLRGHAEENGN